LFFDKISEELYGEIPKPPIVKSRVLLNIEQFEIAQSYVTAKVQNRYGDNVTLNIQGGTPGIELQESLLASSVFEQQRYNHQFWDSLRGTAYAQAVRHT
jgi:hypothetical protein